MVAVLTGNVIHSSKLNPGIWLKELKKELRKNGTSPSFWQIYMGDSLLVFIFIVSNHWNTVGFFNYGKICI